MMVRALLLLAGIIGGVSAAVTAAEPQQSAATAAAASMVGENYPARSLTAPELVAALKDWDQDYAIMLHASWCRYCRQFKPIWHEINKWFVGKEAKQMEVVMFDCEAAVAHQRLCAAVGVKHYPSVLFVGHGSFQQADPLSMKLLGAEEVPERSVLYKGELYYESVRDWCRTMRFLSRCSRWTQALGRLLGRGGSDGGSDGGFGLLGGGGSGGGQVARLTAENAKLRQAAAAASAAASAREAAALEQAGLAAKYGTAGHDAFAVLHGVEYAVNGSMAGQPAKAQEVVASIKRCVAEVVAQYCEGRGDAAEPYCAQVVRCHEQGFAPRECRPAQCPLHEPGCAFASICLNTEVLEQFGPETQSPPPPPHETAGTGGAAAEPTAGEGAASGTGGGGTGAAGGGDPRQAARAAAAAQMGAAGEAAAAAAAAAQETGSSFKEAQPEGGEAAGGGSASWSLEEIEAKLAAAQAAQAAAAPEAQAAAEGGTDVAAPTSPVADGDEEDEVDPAVAAAAAAASAAATGVGGGAVPAGRRGRGPRRRSLWDAESAEAEAPADNTAEVGAQAEAA